MKTEAHQKYGTAQDYPGVTTILNVLDKPGLVKWSNNLGLKGIDSYRFKSERAEVGTLTHHLIMCFFTGETPDTNDYSANQIQEAGQAMILFHKWVKAYEPEPILVEKSLVSHRYNYGGTIDLYAKLHMYGKEFKELIDFKTSPNFYPPHFAQLAAYSNLLEENGYYVENSRLVKLGIIPERETFEEAQLLNLKGYWKLFLHCLAIYNMRLL